MSAGGRASREPGTKLLANASVTGQTKPMQTVHAVFQNDGKWFIARCLDVPVTTQGRTLAAAKKNLRQAVELYLETWGPSPESVPAKEVYLATMEIGA